MHVCEEARPRLTPASATDRAQTPPQLGQTSLHPWRALLRLFPQPLCPCPRGIGPDRCWRPRFKGRARHPFVVCQERGRTFAPPSAAAVRAQGPGAAMGEPKGRRSLDNGAQASRKPREDQEWGASRRDLGELEPPQPPRLPLRRAGRTKGRPSVPPLGAWPSGGRFLPGSGQGLWSWHIPQTAGGQCAPWAPPPGPRAPTAGGTRAVQPVPLCPCAPGTTALPSPPSPPRGAVEPAPPAAPAAERTSGQRSRVPVARAPCPGSARPGCGPPPRPSPASAAVPAAPPGRQTCPGRHLPGGREVAATLVFALDAAQCC